MSKVELRRLTHKLYVVLKTCVYLKNMIVYFLSVLNTNGYELRKNCEQNIKSSYQLMVLERAPRGMRYEVVNW